MDQRYPGKGGLRRAFAFSLAPPGGRFMYDYCAPSPTRHFCLRSPDTRPTNGSCVTFPKRRPCAYRKCSQTPTTRDRLNSTISPRWTASAKHSSRNRRTRPSTQKLKMMTIQKVMLDQMRVSHQRRPPSRGSSTPSSRCSALPCYGLGEIPLLER